MGTTLTGTTPQTTYDSLIKVTDNGPLGGSLKTLTDGLGNDSALALSTGAASVTGTLAVSGNATFDTNTLFVDAASNEVGIGTTSPASKMHLVGGGVSTSISDVSTTLSSRFDIANPAISLGIGYVASDIPMLQTFNNTNNTASNLTINPFGGNVGIGTSSPASKLVVVSDDPSQVSVEASTGNINSQINLKPSGTGIAYIKNQQNTDFAFGTNNTERIRITSTGNVGIGTTAPLNKLDVAGNMSFSSAGANVLRVLQSLGAAGYTGAGIYSAGSMGYGVSSNGAHIFIGGSDGNTELARFTSSGDLSLATGDIILSGAKGIYFDNAASKYLDDYEQGTWTMGISFGGSSVGVTYSANTGSYTKIGRQVTVTGLCILTSKGSSTGAAYITGLPFTIGNASANLAAATVQFNKVTFANQHQGYGSVNTTRIDLTEITEGGVNSTLTDSNFANDSDFILSFTYFA
jgi:hypothetical protein